MAEIEKKNEKAISVSHIEKVYKLYDRRSDRLREALLPVGKKRHKDHYALKDVSFDVGTGECVGIIGTSGSGKSTIIKIRTGDFRVTARMVDLPEPFVPIIPTHSPVPTSKLTSFRA